MRNDQELYQLFRARLPIATLPKDFADRLTKAVLDEVAHLRQEHSMTKACPDSDSEGTTPFNPTTPAPKPAPRPCPAKAMMVFLLLNFLSWPMLQGCTFLATAAVPQSLVSTNLHGVDNQFAHTAPTQLSSKQLTTRPTHLRHDLQGTAQLLQHPPLLPIQPQLPILQLRQRTFVSKASLTPLATASADDVLINLHGPPEITPEITQVISTAMTITLPYEPQLTKQDAPPATPPEPTPVPPEPPQISEQPTSATATPTIDIPLLKPTASPTMLALSPTPILSIFEPTATPGLTAEEPTGTTPDIPTATPTICLLPWPTNEPELASAPIAAETPTSAPIP